MKLHIFCLICAMLCSCASSSEPSSISKASLSKSESKADSSAVAALCELIYGEPCDLCDKQGWYSDGECDTFCQSPDPDCGAGSCVYDGAAYQNGDQFEAGDGCNTCSCNEGLVACTYARCSSTYPQSCQYDGKTYEHGEGFPSADGCNGCGCNDGIVTCTELYCESEPDSCTVDGVVYPDGASDVPDPNSCNTCSCVKGVITSCTEVHCPNPPPGQALCSYYGKQYKHGDSFGAADDCNTCSCDNGSVVCTYAWCGGPPQGYACADKLCGEECIPECPEDEPNCVQPYVIHQCNADGACLPRTATCN